MSEVDQGPPQQFCALEYRASADDRPSSAPESIIILLAMFGNGELEVLLRRKWRQVVNAEDWEYVRELVDDFRARAEFGPEALFEQAQSLGIGPIVTSQVTAEAIQDLYARFEDV